MAFRLYKDTNGIILGQHQYYKSLLYRVQDLPYS